MKLMKLTTALVLLVPLCGGLSAQEETSGLLREVWKRVGGGGIWDLRNSPRFYEDPDISEVIADAEAPRDFGDRYGQRLRGYLVPTQSGKYTFWIASDDNSELLLSTDENKFNLRRIAGIRGMGWGHRSDFVDFHEWNRFGSQKSAEIDLVAGKRYFIEVLHKERTGKDHLSVAWSKGPEGEPTVITSEYLIAYGEDASDLDKDELPDEWEEQHQLRQAATPEQARANGPLGDPDGDGWLNWEERRNGMNPRRAESLAGGLTQEIWYGLLGNRTEQLYAYDQFHQQPDYRGIVRGSSVEEFPGDEQFGMRLRGFLTPMVSGDYRFWISGNNRCDLYLSDGESRFTHRRIASVEPDGEKQGGTKKGQWDKYESQKSELITLEAGKRYYLEVIHKSAWWKGHVGLAWTPPGQENLEEIPVSVLSAYLPGEEDLDDDGLPKEWEELHGFDPESRDGDNGPLGDPDQDRMPNWLEYEFETDPNVFENLEGGFSEEVWRGIHGHFVSDLVNSPKFLKRPSYSGLRLGALALAERGNHYGLRLRATFKAPATGGYTFWVASDNHSELWISEDGQKFQKNLVAWLRGPGSGSDGDYTSREEWDKHPSQKSRTIVLQEGQTYFIEALLKEGWGNDHIQVAWQPPGGEREILPASALTSFLRDENDADDDYLPDDWESGYGLSPKDNGADNLLQEGERGDFDGDGLSNWREYRLGTDPSKADTDGDGVDDRTEVEEYQSDPTIQDVLPPTVYRTFDLTNRVSETAGWEDLNGLVNSGRRGEVTFEVQISEPGVYFAQLVGEVLHPETKTLPIRFLINGAHRASRNLTGRWTEEHTIKVRLPWLSAGTHQLTIDCDNVEKGIRLRIASLQLLKPEGLDRNENGMADWMDGLLRNENKVNGVHASVSSPVCLEGMTSWLGNISISGSSEESSALAGINGGWYADVALSPEGSTSLDVTFEGGAVSESLSVEWLTTDVLSQGSTLLLRQGDALKLGVSGDLSPDQSNFEVLIDGVSVYAGESSTTFVHRFETPGEHLIRGVSGDAEGAITVLVHAADFGEPFHVAAGENREWDLSSVPEPLQLDWDESLRATQIASENEARTFMVGYPELAQSQKHVIARLPGGGPVIARGTVKSFIFADSVYTGDTRTVETLADGTRVIEVGFVLDGPIPGDFSVFLSMWVPDAVFANGETTLTLTAADFDENGIAKIRILKAPGGDHEGAVCHVIELFEGESSLKE